MTMASRTIDRRASRGRRRLLAAWGMMLAAATLPPLEEPALATAADPRLAKIDARALRDAADGQRAAVMIVLSEQADLRQAAQMKDADARGAFVFHALSSVADRTQGPIVELLRRKGLPVQRFFVANVIAATCDRDTLLALAARPDIRRIEASVEAELDRWYQSKSPVLWA